MNKIIVSQEKEVINKEEVWLSITKEEVSLIIQGDVVIYDYPVDAKTKKVHLTLCDNATLHYFRFTKELEEDIHYEITSSHNAKLSFQYSLISTHDNHITINNIMKGNHAKSNIVVKAVANGGTVHLNANGSILDRTKENDFTENLRILMQNDQEQSVIPDLEVATNEVVANHFTTISSIDEESLFYLMSKGLSKDEASSLIKDGFLMHGMPRDTEFYERIKENLS